MDIQNTRLSIQQRKVTNKLRYMKRKGYTREIKITWSAEDIFHLDPDLKPRQVGDVLDELKRNHDCSYGISWDTIQATIDRIKE